MYDQKIQSPRYPHHNAKKYSLPGRCDPKVEQAIQGTGATFSAFVIEATRWALENLEEQEDEPPGTP